MTYQIRAQTLTPESFDEYDRAIHTPPGVKVKPRSRGTAALMNAFGMSR